MVERTCLTAQQLQEIGVPSLGWEEPLEEETATYSSILVWEIHGQKGLVGYSPGGHKESDPAEH